MRSHWPAEPFAEGDQFDYLIGMIEEGWTAAPSEEFRLSAGDDFHIGILHEAADNVNARLFSLSEAYRYAKDGPALPWEHIVCPVEGGCVSGSIPSNVKACYLELKSNFPKGSFIVTSPLYEFC